jgi:hypothetical protein
MMPQLAVYDATAGKDSAEPGQLFILSQLVKTAQSLKIMGSK